MIESTPDDTIVSHHTIHLSWRDRLRVLVGRPIHLDTRQDVWRLEGSLGVRVGAITSRTWVEAVLPRRRGRALVGGYWPAEAALEEPLR